MGNEFGKYLQTLRQIKGLTQEQLGSAVYKNKMTISLIENGKNDPPQEEFLIDLIMALDADEEEKNKLFDLAAKVRKSVPGDIADYFFGNEQIAEAIRIAMKRGKDNSDWMKIKEEFIND